MIPALPDRPFPTIHVVVSCDVRSRLSQSCIFLFFIQTFRIFGHLHWKTEEESIVFIGDRNDVGDHFISSP
ncbi:hypothetical protein M404DRAFT_425804 [Pisolithus tinctorius Marx 270]|uniref:Uncharacterized protein n=1 Tax=Pisolithus tinctorius Marx 270 TaxID=870435 RepID=A0A0C3P1T5_PISTI|nr:hypothetical protein M404DRAFT_425804 [Pisolithus tinctorius Marx 270]